MRKFNFFHKHREFMSFVKKKMFQVLRHLWETVANEYIFWKNNKNFVHSKGHVSYFCLFKFFAFLFINEMLIIYLSMAFVKWLIVWYKFKGVRLWFNTVTALFITHPVANPDPQFLLCHHPPLHTQNNVSNMWLVR